jgi:hypothetical protein
MLGRLFVILALMGIGTIGFLMAFFPRVMPKLTNSYYALIGARTRVAAEDYSKPGVRFAGLFILVAELIWFIIRLRRG